MNDAFIFLAVLVFYPLPWIVAGARNTANRSWVALINLFLGWMVIPWFIALAMAAEGRKR